MIWEVVFWAWAAVALWHARLYKQCIIAVQLSAVYAGAATIVLAAGP